MAHLTKPETNLRVNVEDLHRFKIEAAKRGITMKLLFHELVTKEPPHSSAVTEMFS